VFDRLIGSTSSVKKQIYRLMKNGRLTSSARVGHGSGPSMGRVGSGHKIVLFGWVGLGQLVFELVMIRDGL